MFLDAEPPQFHAHDVQVRTEQSHVVLVLQGNAATKLSYGGIFFILVMSHVFLIPTLKEFKKNRPTFAKVTVKIKSSPVFLTHSV